MSGQDSTVLLHQRLGFQGTLLLKPILRQEPRQGKETEEHISRKD